MNSLETSQTPYSLQTSDHCSSICNGVDHSFVRKRTRATTEQLSVLEDTFTINVSPNSKLRKKLSEQLNMSERSIQIWFQNRRAKVKHMQKKAQLQMQQAAIRAQLYHYQFSSMMQPTMFDFYNTYIQRIPSARAQSVDILSYSSMSLTEPFVPANSFYDICWDDSKLSRQSMPPAPQTENTKLMEVFPVGNKFSSSPSTFCDEPSNYFSMSPANEPTLDDKNLSVNNTESDTWRCNSVSIINSTTFPDSELLNVSFLSKDSPIDPFIIDPIDGHFLQAATLSIGTWHRVKLNTADLVCGFSQSQGGFIWHIEESMSRFKVVIPLNLVTSIEYLDLPENESSVQFYLTHPPLFYMQSNKANKWVQCRDFTESQQGSLCLHHTLKGPADQLKQGLSDLANKLEEIKLLVRFDEPLLSSQNWPSVSGPLYI